MRRERLRSDRSLEPFTVLGLELPKAQALPANVEKLTALLASRVRETDIAGWMADRTLGLILPDTPVEGAWKLASDLADILTPHALHPAMTVYRYPSIDGDDHGLGDETSPDLEDNAPAAAPFRPLDALFMQKLPVWKRGMDIFAAGLGLLVLSPLLLIVAVLVKLTSHGPVFYRQQRDGIGGKPFYIYKFRSMVVDADRLKAQLRHLSEQDGPAFKLKNDPRVTPIGKWLRRTAIDEIPQLFNVLRGEMSLVGPRPMCSREARNCRQWERRRLDVTPGLTCIWQVEGGTKVTFTEWMRMDMRYIESRSLAEDLRLVAFTVPSVLKRDGVY